MKTTLKLLESVQFSKFSTFIVLRYIFFVMCFNLFYGMWLFSAVVLFSVYIIFTLYSQSNYFVCLFLILNHHYQIGSVYFLFHLAVQCAIPVFFWSPIAGVNDRILMILKIIPITIKSGTFLKGKNKTVWPPVQWVVDA